MKKLYAAVSNAPVFSDAECTRIVTRATVGRYLGEYKHEMKGNVIRLDYEAPRYVRKADVSNDPALGAVSTIPTWLAPVIDAYVTQHWNDAGAVYNQFGIHPLIVLAQSALESDWGRSTLAKQGNNFFGLTVGGADARTPYYTTGQQRCNPANGLCFRVYNNARNGFMDYGFWMMHFTPYVSVRPFRMNPAKWPRAIAQSKFIAEEMGDNRDQYESTVARNILWVAETVKKKGLLYPEWVDFSGLS